MTLRNLLWRSSLRYMLRHPWLLGLSVLGVALGVAVVVSIDLANTSARRAFELSAETVAGKATHAVIGTAGGVDEEVYRQLRVDLGMRDIAPVVEGYVMAPRYPGRTFQVLGIDPFAEAPFRGYVSREASPDLSGFLVREGAALIAQQTAEAGGLGVGDTLTVNVAGMAYTLEIVGLLEPGDERSARALENLLIVDIATAQRLFDAAGQLTRIDVLAPDTEPGRLRLAQIQEILPPGAEIQRSSARTETLVQMTRAFNLNLTALSLLALMVGVFLIYNTMTFSVVQRRTYIGQLRALGVTRREIGSLILNEAALVAVAGTALGLLLGFVLGRGLVQLVTQTINDLYYVVTVRRVALEPLTVLKGVGLGIGATVLAAIPPAREATKTTVSTVLRRSHTESRIRFLLPRLSMLGAVLGVMSIGLFLVPTRSIVVSYLGLLCILIAFALVTPAAVIVFVRAVRPLMGWLFGILGRMAARGVATTLSRTSVAIASLMIAIAATVGVGIMVSSFRQTVVAWLNYTVQADIYVQPPSIVFRRAGETLDAVVVERLAATPGVEGAYTVRRVTVGSSEGPTELVVIVPGPLGHETFRFKRGDPDQVWQAFERQEGILISEPYSYRHGLNAGDAVTLQTDRGPRAFSIAGIYYDYGSDQGVVMISRTTYEQYYEDRAVSGVAFDVAEGMDVDAVIRRMQARAPEGRELVIRSNRGLREASLEVFDRTFTITAVLRLLAVVVAFVGVLSAFMALQLERSQELAVLRANGMTPGQVWRFVTMQTGLMGLMAGLLSLPLGITLAYVLIYVINKRSFGWTLQFDVSPSILVQAILLGIVAAVLAGLYPSWKMSRANPALALREE